MTVRDITEAYKGMYLRTKPLTESSNADFKVYGEGFPWEDYPKISETFDKIKSIAKQYKFHELIRADSSDDPEFDWWVKTGPNSRDDVYEKRNDVEEEFIAIAKNNGISNPRGAGSRGRGISNVVYELAREESKSGKTEEVSLKVYVVAEAKGFSTNGHCEIFAYCDPVSWD